MQESFDNRTHLIGSCQVQWTHPPLLIQIRLEFQSSVVASQFSHGPPPLVHASVYHLSLYHLVILYHLLILRILLRGPSGQTPPGSHLGCRGLTSGLVRHLATRPNVHPSLQISTHLHLMYIVQMLEAQFGCVSFLETFLAKKPLPPPYDLVIRHSEDVLSLIKTQESSSDVIAMYFSLIPTQESTNKVWMLVMYTTIHGKLV